ncbi:hypothetical protein NDU88_004634 [Pleurodeles waltl]|uniref:Uncharacterized protein n=1 Tax=Pleurodeles waltl TaxID=8319 RepID=A0AAV7LRJ7_PLEWA|nr:hypothetical protein NDU88_004634 [Pleurodeles waltl]
MSKRFKKQALLPSVTRGKRGERALEEGHLGGDDKMAAPTGGTHKSIITTSDEEDDGWEEQISLDFGGGMPVRPSSTRDGRLMRFILRTSAGREERFARHRGDASGPGFGIQEVYPVTEGEPSTSQGAGFVELGQDIEKELLDYEEETQGADRRHRRSVHKGCKLDVLPETNKKAVRSDQRDGGDRQMLLLEIYLEVRNTEHSQTGVDV